VCCATCIGTHFAPGSARKRRESLENAGLEEEEEAEEEEVYTLLPESSKGRIRPTGGLLKTLRRPQNTTGPAAGDSPQPPASASEP